VPEGWLPIGKVVAAQGLKGELRIYPDSDFPERFLQPGPRWLLRPGESHPQAVDLQSGRYLEGKGLYVIQLAGVADREQAEALRGSLLVVLQSDRPPLEPGEFHILDLVGLPVFDQQTQEQVGTVISIMAAGNDLLEVETGDHQQVLIPLVREIVPMVDLENGRIEITAPPGLIP
jgi:16S rRNA processing protein RimM